MNSDIKRNFKLDQFHQLVELLINQYDIPTETKRVALNLKVASFYRNRSGIQPIEVQLERYNANEPWEVRLSLLLITHHQKLRVLMWLCISTSNTSGSINQTSNDASSIDLKCSHSSLVGSKHSPIT